MSGYYLDLDQMPGHFDPSMKVSWAKHHLRALDKEVREFLQCEPYLLATEDNLETGEHIVHLIGRPLPISMALIAGDWASCLRASLDHLARFLTLTAGGTRNNDASFPILWHDNSNYRRQFNDATSGIPGEAIDVIRSLQPYHHGQAYQSTKLWRLHRFWNIDKHRRIPLHATQHVANVSFPFDMEPIYRRTKNGFVLRFPLAAKGHISLNPPFKMSIEFGDRDEGIIIPYEEMIEIHNFVRDDIFPRFDRFFQPGIAGDERP